MNVTLEMIGKYEMVNKDWIGARQKSRKYIYEEQENLRTKQKQQQQHKQNDTNTDQSDHSYNVIGFVRIIQWLVVV